MNKHKYFNNPICKLINQMVLNLPHLLANHTSIASQNISYIVMETGQRCVPEEQILTQVPKLSS